MIKFFRHIRQRLLTQNKFSKYLLYAIGEIVLVVIGILIALSINNWNEENKEKIELNTIYERIIIDLDDDIQDLSTALDYYKSKMHVFKLVMNDSISIELLDDGLSGIIANNPKTVFNKTGVNLLKVTQNNDSLTVKIIEIYDEMENSTITPFEKKISEEGFALVNSIRQNYSWYPEWVKKKITKGNSSKELQDYFLLSREYRHTVIYNHQLIYKNYVPFLEASIDRLSQIRNEIFQRFN